MRQAGIVAAAGVYALDHHVARLSDDHARARRLAEGLVAAGVAVDLERVETNFVQIDLGLLELDRDEALGRLRKAGVGLSATIHPTVIRAVTHLEITDDDIEQAAGSIAGALLAGARVASSGRRRGRTRSRRRRSRRGGARLARGSTDRRRGRRSQSRRMPRAPRSRPAGSSGRAAR